MTERIVRIDGVDLCIDERGAADDPAVLLIHGAEASMDWWDTEFCELLADSGRRVIRYDHRDTGRSTSYPPGEPGYTADELTGDVAALIGALDLAPAHLVGVSMGGGMAQYVAVRHPDLVSSLTLIATSPAAPGSGDDADLPPMSAELAASFESSAPPPDWTDRAAVQQHYVDGEHQFAGGATVDDERVRRIAGQAFDRSANMATGSNHWIAVGGGTDELGRGDLARITAPTLVIHGEQDPLFPIEHGEALAREIPGARLIRVRGMGHGGPVPSSWDVVVPAIVAHTS